MQERDFLLQLEKRAEEQEKLISRVPLSNVFVHLSLWFGHHPWRIILPFSMLLTIIFRTLLGAAYDNFILRIFGGV